MVYFVSPQVWAWRTGRVRKLKKRITKMIVIFDFEEEIYQQAGVPVEYVGHPLVDMMRPHLTREEFFAKVGLDASIPTIALLPGSRQKEVTANLPLMLDAATRLALNRKLQFVVGVAPTIVRHPLSVLAGEGLRTARLRQQADAGGGAVLVVSGKPAKSGENAISWRFAG